MPNVSIKDVAVQAGVSVTTVSRVLNKRGYISEATYKKVYEAIGILDYQPNQVARHLYNQRTYFIGLMVPDISHPFFAEITHHIELLLYDKGYKLLLCNTKETENREQEYLNMLRQNRVDGIIIGTHMLKTSEYEKISLPVVGLDMLLSDSIPTIYANHEKGGKLAASPFIKNKSKCVLQISGYTDVKCPALVRHIVFAKELVAHNIHCINYELKTNEFKLNQYYDTINRLFDKYPEIDGVFSTDIIVMNAIKCAFERGKKIPDELMIVGYDGVSVAKMIYPSLTYIKQPIEMIAKTIVETLLQKINGEMISENIIIDNVKLISGKTTK